MKNEYVLLHDYGYGREEQLPLNKLELRNFDDCKVYIEDIISQAFVAKLHRKTLYFINNPEKVSVIIRKMK